MVEPVPIVRLRGLSKLYGAVAAINPLDLDIGSGEFCAILGPSGCGKSTLLRMIGGFVAPTSGRVEIDGHDVTKVGPDRRPTNMVFQSYGLFPHLDVAGNVGFGLAIAGKRRAEIAARVREALDLVHLGPYSGRAIQDLSGGQQQRVALARALIMRPRCLLLDEPLAALDLKLRQSMHDELRRIHREIGGTFIFVTHDQTEAFALANRIVVMNAGRIEQVGPAEDVYFSPRTAFVADFVGEANILRGHRVDGTLTLEAGPAIPCPGPDGLASLVIRPERVAVERRDGDVSVIGTVMDVVFLGNALKIEARLSTGERLRVREGEIGRRRSWTVGEQVRFCWTPADQRVVERSA